MVDSDTPNREAMLRRHSPVASLHSASKRGYFIPMVDKLSISGHQSIKREPGQPKMSRKLTANEERHEVTPPVPRLSLAMEPNDVKRVPAMHPTMALIRFLFLARYRVSPRSRNVRTTPKRRESSTSPIPAFFFVSGGSRTVVSLTIPKGTTK